MSKRCSKLCMKLLEHLIVEKGDVKSRCASLGSGTTTVMQILWSFDSKGMCEGITTLLRDNQDISSTARKRVLKKGFTKNQGSNRT